MTYSITKAAERDIKDVLANTLKSFGTHQLSIYEQIIEKGLTMIADEPLRVGSVDRSEIRPGIRLFHLELAAGRRGAAAHCLYYSAEMMPSGKAKVVVLRVLHEQMEPRNRVVRSLKGFQS